jgi:formylglycine-generating enzyme required for sulfatase activity
LSGGATATSYPLSESDTPPDITKDACRTTQLWLRLVQPGTFKMGSRKAVGATRHDVTLTKPYYVGVFEVTQKQWVLVAGRNPSFHKAETIPVTGLSFDMIRGPSDGWNWPLNNGVDDTSFLGKLRARTGLTFDLPTEAQWEYACRAGTTTDLNSGKNIKDNKQDDEMDKLGHYRISYDRDQAKMTFKSPNPGTFFSKSTKVGSFLPNAWGLYDMHGNVQEFCLDRQSTYPKEPKETVIDPRGAPRGDRRVIRGGYWYSNASECISAYRNFQNRIGRDASIGMRAVVLPDGGTPAPKRSK